MKFQTKTVRLVGSLQKQTALAMINSAPEAAGLEVVLREVPKQRTDPQNKLMWALLGDIAQQVWVDKRQFVSDTWNIYFKALNLPEGNEDDLSDLVKNPDTYEKWRVLPNGDRQLNASTTDLSMNGFSQYIEKMCVFAAQKNVVQGARYE